MTELKPCPFCGSDNTETTNYPDNPLWKRYERHCLNCYGAYLYAPTLDYLNDKWNTRPSLWTTITDEASLPKESGTYLTVESNRINKMNRVLTYYTKEDGWIGVSQNWIIKWMPIPEDE